MLGSPCKFVNFSAGKGHFGERSTVIAAATHLVVLTTTIVFGGGAYTLNPHQVDMLVLWYKFVTLEREGARAHQIGKPE